MSYLLLEQIRQIANLRLEKAALDSVVEVGPGFGSFAALLHVEGLKSYSSIDTIEMGLVFREVMETVFER